ncbi:hypothetical protein H4W34_003419 [Actinomadura algeriensis]|uniref:Uncharacterized protein n=1 Tax=Actinomadura algeriensis TaxID=1679523 RepID=A0ABR9JSN7_9ACTN|nr:hypothetical protein [Actinomadura algeriensis]
MSPEQVRGALVCTWITFTVTLPLSWHNPSDDFLLGEAGYWSPVLIGLVFLVWIAAQAVLRPRPRGI